MHPLLYLTSPLPRRTLAYFLPIAFRHYPGFFVCGIFNVFLHAVQPFVSIMMTPLILDELLGDRNPEKLFLYAAVIAVGGTALSLAGSITDVILEEYNEKMENFFTEEMSTRVMELDFQLTEDKKALDQIEAARTDMSWYSGGVYGISVQLFNAVTNIIKITGVISLILLHAPLLFIITVVLLVVNTITNGRTNAIEREAFRRLSKLNRIFGYLGWELVDLRYGKDIRLYGARDMMLEKWNGYNQDSVRNWKWQADQNLPLNTINTVCDAAKDFCTYR